MRWLEGHGWDLDRWGRWPTADDLETVAPGRRCALWAHDHHALLGEPGGAGDLRRRSRSTPDPPGGVIRRDAGGEPEGVLLRGRRRAGRRSRPAIPVEDDSSGRSSTVSQELLALGVVAVHDPGRRSPDDPTSAGRTRPMRTSPRRGGLPHPGPSRRCARTRSTRRSPAGFEAATSWAPTPTAGPRRLAEAVRRRDAGVADRGAARRHRARARPAARRRTGDGASGRHRQRALRELVERAAAGGIATQIHAIGDAAVRAALDVLAPTAGRACRSCPRIEHVQLVDPADRGRFAAGGIAASVQPVHLGSDAAQARRLWGARAEVGGYAWASLAATGAVIAFGTDAPGRAVRPVARDRARRLPGGPALAGRDAAVRAGRGADRRPGAPRRLRRPGRVGAARPTAGG